jgi:hypothetical protein
MPSAADKVNALINRLQEFTFETNYHKSTGEAQSANYLDKSRTDYTTQCQFVNAKLENDELI